MTKSDRIRASCPHAVTQCVTISRTFALKRPIMVKSIFSDGTPFFVPLPKIYHVNRLDYRFIYTLMVTLIFFNRRIRLNNNHKIIRSKYLLLSDWLNLPAYFLIPPSITGKF